MQDNFGQCGRCRRFDERYRLACFENLANLKDVNLFKPYIFGIAGNLNKMRFRRKKFRAEFNEAELKHLVDSGKSPEAVAEFNLIYAKILQLPEKMSQALILFYINDLSLEEIQQIQGDSLSSVKQRLKRGREKLFNMLDTPEQIRVATLLFTF